MALTKWGFIYTLGAEGDPDEHTDVIGSEACRLITVAVERVDQAPEAAKKLVDQGAELIELCGAFGPVWTGRVIEAIDGAVPVGGVFYGAEATDQMHELFREERVAE